MNNLELRLKKLEEQMQQRIERSNLVFELLSQQSQHQTLSFNLLIALLPDTVDFSLLAQFVSKQIEQYQQIMTQLPQDDVAGREYVHSLLDDLTQTQQALAQRI